MASGARADVERLAARIFDSGSRQLALEDSVPLITEPDDKGIEARAQTWGTTWVARASPPKVESIPTSRAGSQLTVSLDSRSTPPDRWLLHLALTEGSPKGSLIDYTLFYLTPHSRRVGKLEIRWGWWEVVFPFGNPPESAPFFNRSEPPWSDDQRSWLQSSRALYGWQHEHVEYDDGPDEKRFIDDVAEGDTLMWDADAWEALQHRREPDGWQPPTLDLSGYLTRHAAVAEACRRIDPDGRIGRGMLGL